MVMGSREMHDEEAARKPRRRTRMVEIARRYQVAVLAGAAAFLVVLVVVTRFWPAAGP